MSLSYQPVSPSSTLCPSPTLYYPSNDSHKPSLTWSLLLAAFLLWGNSPTRSYIFGPPPVSSPSALLSLYQAHLSTFSFCLVCTVFFSNLGIFLQASPSALSYIPSLQSQISTSFLTWKYISGIFYSFSWKVKFKFYSNTLRKLFPGTYLRENLFGWDTKKTIMSVALKKKKHSEKMENSGDGGYSSES